MRATCVLTSDHSQSCFFCGVRDAGLRRCFTAALCDQGSRSSASPSLGAGRFGSSHQLDKVLGKLGRQCHTIRQRGESKVFQQTGILLEIEPMTLRIVCGVSRHHSGTLDDVHHVDAPTNLNQERKDLGGNTETPLVLNVTVEMQLRSEWASFTSRLFHGSFKCSLPCLHSALCASLATLALSVRSRLCRCGRPLQMATIAHRVLRRAWCGGVSSQRRAQLHK